MSEIVNRVANSPIVTLDLEKFYKNKPRVVFDLAPFLFQGLVLKETEFRQSLKEVDWNIYSEKVVAITCSVDAIIPNWAFMLVGIYLSKIGVEYIFGDLDDLENFLFEQALRNINPEDYKAKPVVVKGCSKHPVPLYAYGRVVSMIFPFAKSIMYGEPCSTVPLYKSPKIR